MLVGNFFQAKAQRNQSSESGLIMNQGAKKKLCALVL